MNTPDFENNRTEKNKRALFLGISIFLICGIVLISCALIFSPIRYKLKVNEGYKLLNEGSYERAENTFEKAILMNEKRVEAYIGKATAMSYKTDITEENKKNIFNVLDVGYEMSKDKAILEYKKEMEEALYKTSSGEEGILSESTIYSDFEKAEDFYISWIYGQFYIDYQSVKEEGNKVTAYVKDYNINTSQKLKDEINKHFSDKMAENYIKQLNPRDENGNLKINIRDGVGDNGYAVKNHSIQKVSDNEYILTLYEEFTMGEVTNIPQKIENKLRCTVKNGKWVFENYASTTHFIEKIFQ